MPMQQVQGVQIHGRTEHEFATLTSDGAKQRLDVSAATIGALIPSDYDFISMTYTSGNMTGVVYKVGGSGGTTVATLTITYDTSGSMSTVTRT